MPVRYITVTPVTKLFKPATRAFGDVAIVGTADSNALGPFKIPVPVTNPDAIGYETRTALGADINDTAEIISAPSTASGFPKSFPFTIRIDQESLAVTKIDSGNWSVARGTDNTKAAAHTKGTAIVYKVLDRSVDAPGDETRTSLTAPVDANSDTITVPKSAAGQTEFPFKVRIDKEVLAVTKITGTSWTVTRAADGTQAAAHAKDATVIYNAPPPFFRGNLGAAVRKALEQSPGPSTVWAVRTESGDVAAALKEVAKLDVQIVVLANTPLKPPASGSTTPVGLSDLEALAGHVSSVSKTGGDGKERVGVAMLGKGVTSTDLVSGNLSIDRMVLVAHNSDEDAAAAVAGTVAGYEPHISLLLKQVKISMDTLFSDSEIDGFDKARVNWLTDPTLLPGKGLFMGEGYTLGADMPYIDVVRTVDDISFRLKAQLIRSIGDLRISRSGLRALVSQMTAVLQPLREREVIESYDVFLPLLVLLDKDPNDLNDAELQRINDVQNARAVDAIVTVDYAGAIHRLNINLIFK